MTLSRIRPQSEQTYKTHWQTYIQSKTKYKPSKMVSRRIIQRREKRQRKKKIKAQANSKDYIIKQALYHTEQCCLRNFGFIANPSLSLHQNFRIMLQSKSSPIFQQPKNLTYHNLCTLNTIPPGTKQLLGFNLKHCLATNHMNYNINKITLKMAYAIRTEFHLKELGCPTDQKY